MIYGVDISTIIFEKHWQIILETSSVELPILLNVDKLGEYSELC